MASVIGELMGKSNGNCAGKSGSMHLYSNEFYGGHGIVAAQVSYSTFMTYISLAISVNTLFCLY